MGKVTKIEWADATWNVWYGCHKISNGCENCYAYRELTAYGKDPTVVTRSKTTFKDPLKWKEPRRIFVCSWSDFFIEEADAWRPEAWEIMRQAPQHVYMILTKRPKLISERLPSDWKNGWPNVWLGVTVEDEANLWRMDELASISAKVHFLSAEPLLGSLGKPSLHGIQWVIVGGESGPNHRPCKIEWVREIRDQCIAQGVAFFFKQWSDVRPKKLGRNLDGRTWEEYPSVHGVSNHAT